VDLGMWSSAASQSVATVWRSRLAIMAAERQARGPVVSRPRKDDAIGLGWTRLRAYPTRRSSLSHSCSSGRVRVALKIAASRADTASVDKAWRALRAWRALSVGADS